MEAGRRNRKTSPSASPQDGPGEALNRSARRPVIFTGPGNQREALAEPRGQRFRAVAPEREAAALLRPIEGEGGNDRNRARPGRRSKRLDIGVLSSLVGEEMEGGAVVPDAPAPVRYPLSHVGDDEMRTL